MNGEPEPPEQKPELTFKAIVSNNVKGCYNVHGIADDTSLAPPSLNPDDWKILNGNKPVVSHLDTVGERKIDPVGFYLTENNLALFYNSGWNNYDRFHEIQKQRGYRPASNQAGSLIAFHDDFTFEDYPENTVLDQPQKWQGRNRVNPYALVWHPHHKIFYMFYGDFAEGGDCDKYPGRRALGLAKSKDLVTWEYISTDKPFMHIEQAYEIVPEAFPNTNFCREGRLYAFGATWQNDQIYLGIGGSIDSTNWTGIIRSREPEEYWKPVSGESIRPMPIRIGGKWYRAQNIRDPHDPNKRAIAIAVSDNLNGRGTNHYVISTGHDSSAGVSRQLFAYKGKWHIAYRQDDGNGFRDMYIARER